MIPAAELFPKWLWGVLSKNFEFWAKPSDDFRLQFDANYLFSIKLRAYYTIVKHTRKFCGNCMRFPIVIFRSKTNLLIQKSAQS